MLSTSAPSSDLFQPDAQVIHLAEAINWFLFANSIGVAFVTKGLIPNRILDLLWDHADLVRAQIGIIALDEKVSGTFEPNAANPRTRLKQIDKLARAGVRTEARVDPILPGVTDGAAALESLFAALSDVGVTRAAIDLLFLRPAIVESLRRNLDRETFEQLASGFPQPLQQYTTKLPLDLRRRSFARIEELAAAQGIATGVCTCENPEFGPDTCNIIGEWPPPTGPLSLMDVF